MNIGFSEGSESQLREHLIEELDHQLVPTEAWNKLVLWYGIAAGQVNGPLVANADMSSSHVPFQLMLLSASSLQLSFIFRSCQFIKYDILQQLSY